MILPTVTITRVAPFAVLLLLVQGCGGGPTSSVWMKDGQAVGRVWKCPAPYGKEYRYVDNSDRLIRSERRDLADALLPGACTVQYEYDQANRLVEECHYDAAEKLAIGERGYATRRCTYSASDSDNVVEEHALRDTEGREVCGADGYAYAKLVYLGADVKDVFLEDTQKKPASARWDGVDGTARVAYEKLQGIGEIRCGVYYDPAGKVVQRKMVSGTCYFYQVTEHRR